MWRGYNVGSIFQYLQEDILDENEENSHRSSLVYKYPSLYVYNDGCEIRDCTEIDAEYGIEDGRIIVIRDDVHLKQLILHQIPLNLYTMHRFRPKSTIWVGMGDTSHG